MFQRHYAGLVCRLSLLFLAISFVTAQESEDRQEEKNEQDVAVEMVVSASRRPEKKLEAPATIETITDKDLALSAATTFSGAVSNLKGVDFANGGITLQKISARGFSTSYNSRMLSMVNGRLATLPGAGLPQGIFTPTSTLDIKTIEVVLGPASALYGPNASAGVMNIITKNPWDEDGVALSQKIGEQSLTDTHLRYADTSSDGRWGWKLTGNYLNANEFDSDNVYFGDPAIAGQNQTLFTGNPDLSPEEAQNLVDFYRSQGTAFDQFELSGDEVRSSKYEISGYYKQNDLLASATYGWSETTGFGTTNVGTNRIKNWEVEYFQAEVSHPRYYFQYTKTDNFAGDTYSIQNVAGPVAAGVPFETAITSTDLALFYDASGLEDIEGQFNFEVGPVEVIAGASYRQYTPDSNATYLDDFRDASGNVTNDIGRDETGAYVQLDYRALDEKLRLTGAIRYDDSNEFDSETSPKFSVTYTHNNIHNFRLNYNKAHRDPAIIENHLFFFGGLARGNLNGYTVTDSSGNQTFFPGLQPELVETIEVGYRGVLGSVSVDGVAYTSDYENFISPLQLITGAGPAVDSNGNIIPVLLTYLNYGQAKVEGFDIGMNYFQGSKFHLNLNYGYQKLSSFDNSTAIPDLPFNTPKSKIKASLNFKDIGWENTFFTLSGRHVDGYEYHSGRWNGVIEKNTIVDSSLGFNWEPQEMLFKISVSNLFDSDKTELIGVPAVPRFFTAEIVKRF